MKKILVVEDSKVALKILQNIIDIESDFEALYAASYAQAQELLSAHQQEIIAALVDYHLPDAHEGEAIDFMLAQGVPTIVLTASFDEQRRSSLLKKGIADYIIKEGKFSYYYAIKLVNRLWKNRNIKVLVAEDSTTSRHYIRDLLKLQLFQVFEAEDGLEAMQVLTDNPDIKMLITDYYMPNMDGFELVQKIRNKYQKPDLVIIGLSAESKDSLSAKFIKNGANDFLRKPFNREEFQCRIMHNVDSLEYLEQIRNTANRDFLTGAYNRRYFFTEGEQIFLQAKQKSTPLAVAIIDIDFFKQINDTYGHDAGDKVLSFLSRKLNQMLPRFLVARAGGEEFFILMQGLNNKQACTLINEVRSIIHNTPIEIGEQSITMTFSAGVSNLVQNSLDEQIKIADTALYRAKEAGRNCVLGDE